MRAEKDSSAEEHNQKYENEAEEKSILALSLKVQESKNEELNAAIEQVKAEKESLVQEQNQQKENEA